jgi:hypothetical protein
MDTNNESGASRRQLFEALQSQQRTLEAMASHIKGQNTKISALQQVVAWVGKVAGIESQVVSGLKLADVENPAQPVPSGGSEPPSVTTEEARQPDAKADILTPGGVPGNDTAADATTSVDSVGGTILNTPLNLNEQDVTKAVADPAIQSPPTGEDAHQPIDIHSRDVINTPQMFPWTLTSKQVHERTMASLRLAKLRIAANLTSERDFLTLGDKIAKDSSLTGRDIDKETITLSAVVKSATVNQPQVRQASRSTVPQAPRSIRTAPSMQSAPTGFRATAAATDDDFSE